ncbi:THUMP domain-containing class I SAM-dependent RNA methyltransferase [Aurantibacillus circumpalustris]|uniref:THUMP domain-containing class I SAM-dependent RNA methyltransferase n=1 Tax=Aurantibacillus circumpalustris TaxID=3036359 RepID=UPI00295AE0E1|nr:class I SAM-dependent RNA methyltransferase [Aurantibacillus circumpalustris]
MKISYDYTHTGDFEMKVTTFFGLEEILAKELLQLGGKDITEFKRGVSVVGDIGFLYKANLCLHTALKVIVPIAKFEANNEQELYDNIKLIDWERFISNSDTLMVESVLNSENFTHSQFVSQKVKDGIVDRFRDKTGSRPDVDLLHPAFKLYVHIYKNEVSLNIDSSGDPLYKRGYRSDINEAPMKEVLAAGLVKLSGWEKHHLLVDGMCGAGTIAIEAALWANNIPPGYYRNEFGFMRWRNFDEKTYDTIYESSINKIRNDKVEIIANDIDFPTLKKAKINTKNAKVDDVITCTQESFFDITPPRQAGVVILNPPYGERIPVAEIENLYKEIGNKLKKDFKGFNAWIITSSPEAIKSIGLRPSRRIHVFNGSLECRYLKFELYDGSKKASKNPDTMTRK